MSAPVIWLDAETTGFSQNKNGIVSLAAIADIDEGRDVIAHTWHMNPVGREIEDSALEVNGFTREDIATFPDWTTVLVPFVQWVAKAVGQANLPVRVGGFNHKAFDGRFVTAWFEACGGLRVSDIFIFDDTLDVLLLVRKDPRFDALPSRKLEVVAKALGVDLGEDAHNAEADITATREVYYRLLGGHDVVLS